MHRLERDDKTLFAVLLSGRLTQPEYEVFRAHFESEIRHHKTLRLMFEIEDRLSWQPRSQWRGLKFDSNHHTDIYKLAIVGRDPVWREWVGTAFSPMKIGQVLQFSSDQKLLAKTWLER
jgi:hypothetical protein